MYELSPPRHHPCIGRFYSTLVEKFAQEKADLDDIRIVVICLIGFAGFLRYSELAALKESDLHIFSDHMEIFIVFSRISGVMGSFFGSLVGQNSLSSCHYLLNDVILCWVICGS